MSFSIFTQHNIRINNNKIKPFFQIYVIDSADRKRFEETGQVCTFRVHIFILNVVICKIAFCYCQAKLKSSKIWFVVTEVNFNKTELSFTLPCLFIPENGTNNVSPVKLIVYNQCFIRQNAGFKLSPLTFTVGHVLLKSVIIRAALVLNMTLNGFASDRVSKSDRNARTGLVSTSLAASVCVCCRSWRSCWTRRS